MKIVYEKTQYYRFAFVFGYSTPALNYCRFLKSSYGWKNFTFYQDKWRFNDPTIVFLLKMQFPSILVDPQVQEIVSLEDKKCKEEHAIATKAKEIKDKVDSDIVIPGIKGHLYPYQKVGVEFFTNSKGRAILADTMGTGKTVQTLGYVLKANHKRTLVVCPASVKYSWETEIKKWLPDKQLILMLSGKPSPDFVESLDCFFSFYSKIGNNRLEKVNDINSASNNPSELGKIRRKSGVFLKNSSKFFPAKTSKPIDQSDVCVINSNSPTSISFDARNTTFSVNNSSEICDIGLGRGELKSRRSSFDSVKKNTTSRHLASQVVPFAEDCFAIDTKTDGDLSVRSSFTKLFHKDFDKFFAPGFSFDDIHLFIIINYDILSKWGDVFKKLNIDCVVFDESQFLKSPSAIRTRAARDISRRIKSVIMLSGTPLLSRPIELFTMLNIIDPSTWNNYYEYAGRYCDGHKGKWGYEAKGATNLAELTDRISRYFLRRTKDQVLKDLPPKNRMTLPVDLPAQAKKDYAKASKEFIKFLKENKKKKDKEVARTLNAESLTKINYLREIAVMGRLDAAKELIDSIIDAGEKVLVFSSFNAPLEELADEYFDKAVMITGKVNPEERGEIVKRFQTDQKVQVFLGGYLSAGTGITLTAASNVILLDYPYRPGDTEQSIDRCHRPGTKASSINIYQLHSRGTIDDYMSKILERKKIIFDVVVGSQTSGVKDEKMIDELIEILEGGE